jgi:hypothetical protein
MQCERSTETNPGKHNLRACVQPRARTPFYPPAHTYTHTHTHSAAGGEEGRETEKEEGGKKEGREKKRRMEGKKNASKDGMKAARKEGGKGRKKPQAPMRSISRDPDNANV